MIHICYTLSDKKGTYTKMIGLSMCSVFQHTNEWVTVHLLHDQSLSDDNRRNLMKLVRTYGHQIVFLDIEKPFKERLKALAEFNKWMDGKIKQGVSLAIWYRLLMGEIIEGVDRIIYLDADTVVNLDIKELWEEETGESGLAAVPDIIIQEGHISHLVNKGLYPEKKYFNSGVLLFDMTRFGKQEGLLESGAEFLKRHDLIDYPDQDILNYFFGGKTNLLDEKYNTLVSRELGRKRNVLEPRIYHYANRQYAFDYGNNYHRLFLDTFAVTPWCNADFFCRLSHNIQQNSRSKLLVFANLVAGKKRIVVGHEEDREKYTKMLMLKEGERYFTAKELDQSGMRLEPNEILIFFLPFEEFMSVKKHLEDCGCTEGIHFLNGNILVTPDAAQDAKAFLEA